MASIFSTQNLQTFLRRKNLRPPSRPVPPGPAAGLPPGRGPRGAPSRAALSARPAGASTVAVPLAAAAVLLTSSAMFLLHGLLRAWFSDVLPRRAAVKASYAPTVAGSPPGAVASGAASAGASATAV